MRQLLVTPDPAVMMTGKMQGLLSAAPEAVDVLHQCGSVRSQRGSWKRPPALNPQGSPYYGSRRGYNHDRAPDPAAAFRLIISAD